MQLLWAPHMLLWLRSGSGGPGWNRVPGSPKLSAQPLISSQLLAQPFGSLLSLSLSGILLV